MHAEEDTLGEQVCEADLEIKNAEGLHMRPAMQFVDLANRFDCDVSVSNGENTVDAYQQVNGQSTADAYQQVSGHQYFVLILMPRSFISHFCILLLLL